MISNSSCILSFSVLFELLLFMSAQLQLVKQLQDVKLSCQVQAPWQSIISAAICLLRYDLSDQSVSSVCLLSCITSAQLQYASSAAIYQLSSAAIWRLGCNLSNKLPGQLQLVSSAAPCQLRWNLPFQLQRVGSAVVCLLICKLEFKLTTENLKVVICPWWRRKGLIRVAWHIFVQASCQVEFGICCIIKYLNKFRIPKLPRFTSNFENVWQLILQNQKTLNIKLNSCKSFPEQSTCQ